MPSPSSPTLVEVALPLPLPTFFTYAAPSHQVPPPGVRVRVPFGPKEMVGVVFGPAQAPPAKGRLRTILEQLDPEPLIDPEALKLARWLADYWFAPPGEAISLLMPPRMIDGADAPNPKAILYVRPCPQPPSGRLGPKMLAVFEWLSAHGEASADTVRAATGATLDSLRRLEERGYITLDSETRFRDPLAGVNMAALKSPGARHPLTAAQQAAVDAVHTSFGRYAGFLLYGVTGSGKTEVYLELIEHALKRGEGTLVLLPEISLTPQLVARFKTRLGERVAVQHSGLDPLARHEQWLRIRNGELPVVVGARSALFAPVKNLGLVIVDEEHEPSFKQENSPRYHARDLALVRGHLAKVPVVLGSATPSLESWVNVSRGKLQCLSLPTRAHQQRPLPKVEVVDLTQAPFAQPDEACQHELLKGPERLLSQSLVNGLRETLGRGEQSILFLNRRGYASALQCRECGATVDCPSCSVSYTLHRSKRRLICHYCDGTLPIPIACPRCRHEDMGEVGSGTELVEERLQGYLPQARIARMDKDTTRGNALLRLLTRFRRGDIDILIGTQMVAKGHDFPGVTFVGVLLAEQGLAFPDPRAAERTFQLLTQIAGRAGRGEREGRVLIQTRMPNHYAITHANHHDVTGFLNLERDLREARGFPPFSHLALFRIHGPTLEHVESTARTLARELQALAHEDTFITPAQPAPIERVKERFRFQVLVRATSRQNLRYLLEASRTLWSARQTHHTQVSVDIDPLNFL